MRNLPTPRQEAFAQEFAKTRSIGLAYRVAYDCPDDADPRQIDKHARQAIKAPVVQRRIEEIIADATAETVFSVREALSRWLLIAMADPNELVSVKIGACRYCHGQDHGYHWREREYLRALDEYELQASIGVKGARVPDVGGGFDYDATAEPHPNCPECHGEGVPRTVFKDTESLSPAARALYGGAKQTKDGLQIIMADRMKALENACRIIGAFDDKLSLTADVRKMVAAVTLETNDPIAAAKAYQEMITGIAAS